MSGQDVVSRATQRGAERARVTQRTGAWRLLAVLAWAGVAGPVVFTVAFVAQGLARRGEYSAAAETISALAAGPYGWVQDVNFVVFGVLLFAFAIGLHLGVRRSRAGVVGPAIMAWTGVGAVLAAVFPLREDAAGLTVDPTGLHRPNAVLFFLSVGVGLVVLSRRLARDPRWAGLAAYTLVTGVVAVVLFVGLPLLVLPEDGALHAWAGLYQRAVLAVWFPCLLVLALRLRRVANGWDGPAVGP